LSTIKYLGDITQSD